MDFRDVTGTRWKMFYNQNQATSPARLRLLRQRAKTLNERHNRTDPFTWRDVRYEKHHTPEKPSHSKDERTGERIMLLDEAIIGEDMGSAYRILSEKTYNYRGALGYYIDGYCHETMEGHVYKIRCPRGTLYIPVTVCDGWDGVIYWMDDKYLVPKGGDEEAHEEAMKEVARDADHIAEREAEEARDHWMEDVAEQEVENAIEELKEIKENIFTAIRDLQYMKKGNILREDSEENISIRHRIIDDIRKFVQRRKKIRKRTDEIIESPWIIWNDY